MIKITERKLFILFVAFLLGVFFIIQQRGFEKLNTLLVRDSSSNVFQEVRILRKKNSELRKEVDQLEENLATAKDKNSALKSIEEEIEKYKELTGDEPVFGEGIEIILNKEIGTAWIVDLINELFNSGAEAVDLNGTRITDDSAGFDTLPKGQILFHGKIIKEPYVFRAIGDAKTLKEIIGSPGGVIGRLKSNYGDLKITIEEKGLIKMSAVE